MASETPSRVQVTVLSNSPLVDKQRVFWSVYARPRVWTLHSIGQLSPATTDHRASALRRVVRFSLRTRPISPLARQRRAPLPAQAPPVVVHESSFKYTVDVQLPNIIQPEMVTIAAIKGDKMKVVADAWHMESNCHYEWLITFPPRDIDMSKVHAKFGQDGLLSIDVRRLYYTAQ
ncbi:hypothetical protein BDZ89DRAFT_839474 [Hymenopellis radicata]|nr:hypothetical protein BDZ89DRAFT_839474 [Hymenopellis radicata]